MSSRSAVETYRSLHSTIKFAEGAGPIHTVLIVDVDRDRPSGVAENVAIAFARAGDCCAFVDADLRAAPVNGTGLADLLRDPSTELPGTPDENGLTRIGAGSSGSPDLLSGSRFKHALERLRSRYDYVVVTCPELPEYGDAVAIAPVVDAVILVISAGVTGRDEAVQARDALERVGARILGMVMVERPRRWF